MTQYLIALSLSLTFSFLNAQSIVINEINADNPGADTEEFIELFGVPGTPLDGMALVLFDGSSDQSYLSIDLDGFSLNADGFFVIADSAVIGADYYFSNLSANIQNGADAVALYYANAADFPNGSTANGTSLIDAQVLLS